MKIKKLGIAFSFSHLMLCFFFILSTGYGYMFPTDECAKQIGAFLVLLTLFTAIFYKVLFFGNKFSYLIYLIFIYIAFRGVKAMFCFQFGANIKSAIFTICILVIALVLFYFYCKKRKKFTSFTQNLILFFIPFALISTFKLSTSLLKLQKDISLKAYQPIRSSSKIFWIIFDELDQYLVFENPNSPYFQELNLLKSESVYAKKALQPGSCTNISLPAYTTGLLVNNATLDGPYHLKLKLESGKSVDWKRTSNIFRKAFNLGYNSALIGWYHPYDRIFASDLAYIGLEAFFNNKTKKNKLSSFIDTVANQLLAFFNFNFGKPFQVLFNKPLIPKALIKNEEFARDEKWYNNLLTHMKTAIDNDQLNFNFFHLPIPHYPTCYDSKTNKVGKATTNYYENVFLVDKTIGWLRKQLTAKNLWDSSIIIVTSDHWLRTEKGFVDKYIAQESTAFNELLEKRKAPYVPFLIKMPHQKKMLQVNREFNSIILYNLILEMMEQKLTTADEVASIINKPFDY